MKRLEINAQQGDIRFDIQDKKNLGVKNGGQVNVAQHTHGLVVVELGMPYAIIQTLYPESELTARARSKVDSPIYKDSPETPIEIFTSRKVTHHGHLNLPRVLLRDWREQDATLKNVAAVSFTSGIVLLPDNASESETVIMEKTQKLFPLDKFNAEERGKDFDEFPLDLYGIVYREWLMEEKKKLKEVIDNGGVYPGLVRGETVFERDLAESLYVDILPTRTRN